MKNKKCKCTCINCVCCNVWEWIKSKVKKCVDVLKSWW